MVARYQDVGQFLAENGGDRCSVYPQGSFLLGTAINPPQQTEYDIDLVFRDGMTKDDTSQADLKERVGGMLEAYNDHKVGADDAITDRSRSSESEGTRLASMSRTASTITDEGLRRDRWRRLGSAGCIRRRPRPKFRYRGATRRATLDSGFGGGVPDKNRTEWTGGTASRSHADRRQRLAP